MMLGKRSRAPFRRTTSMTGITVDLGSNTEAPPPPPPPGKQRLTTGGEMDGYDHMLSPRYFGRSSSGEFRLVETADFLRSCGLCNRRLAPGRDIYMYRGDTAFCSLECREQQMKQDERTEGQTATAAAATGKSGEIHRSEMAATTGKSSSNSRTVAA